MIALIDADSIIYKVAWVHRDAEHVNQVLNGVDIFITEILTAVNAESYLGFIGNGKCFRYDIAVTQPYKGNRPEELEWVAKWKEPIKKHMVEKWRFILLDKIEADDAVSICQRMMVNTIICGQDKDLLQIPGNHYNYDNKSFTIVDVLGTIDYKKNKLLGYGEKFFWGQMITGDRTDGITGLKGKGPAFAAKLLRDVDTVEECTNLVKALYEEGLGLAYFIEQYSLLRMLEVESYGFTIPEPIEWKRKEEEQSLSFDTSVWKEQDS